MSILTNRTLIKFRFKNSKKDKYSYFGAEISLPIQAMLPNTKYSRIELPAHHIYLWWLTLKLCCLPILVSNQNETI